MASDLEIDDGDYRNHKWFLKIKFNIITYGDRPKESTYENTKKSYLSIGLEN